MPWNQPGSNDRDPWGQGNGQNGPPDLDEVIRDLQKKFGGLFGGGGSGRKGGGRLPSFSSKQSGLSQSFWWRYGSRPVFMWSNKGNRQLKCVLAPTRLSRKPV